MTRGTAIIDPDLLRKLDQNDSLTISRLLWPERNANVPLTTDLLFSSLSQLKEIPPAIDAEFDRYIVRQKAAYPTETIGVGEGFDVQLFDRANLKSRDTRFVLAGIVNRMDRAYVSEEACGEIRLIYRLVRFESKPEGGKTATRLPMTFNLVMKARDARQTDASGKPVTCAEVARRWLDNGDWQGLIGSGISPSDAMLDRIETNIQISIAPKSALHDFRSDYLLKVFKYNAATKTFEESTLENQIDRDHILADNDLRRDFKAWLLAPENLREFDRGAVLIPETFLAKAAVVPTPAGLDASPLQPEFGMVQGRGQGQQQGRAGLHRQRRGRRAEAGGGARHRHAEHPLGRGLPAPPQRRHLRRLPPDPRHRRLPFSGRRLAGGQAVELHHRAGLAAFLRRPGPPPRHPDRIRRGQTP
ncbi:hypothetical protein ACVMHY_008295 [Bradyrhizobium barranii subsp. barranii]